MRDGIPNGEGRKFFKDFTIYTGNFVNGVFDGQGFLVMPRQKKIYNKKKIDISYNLNICDIKWP